MKLETRHSSHVAGSSATADVLLNVAEELFAERGFNGVSIRDITAKAGANLGAVTYHFGTKENLLAAILARGATALNRSRTERFALLGRDGGTMSVEGVLRAFIEPTYALADTPSGARFLRIQNDISAERTDVPRDVLATHYDPVGREFMRLLAIAAPHLSANALALYFQFILGALIYALEQTHRFPVALPGEGAELRRQREKAELVRFLSNALRP